MRPRARQEVIIAQMEAAYDKLWDRLESQCGAPIPAPVRRHVEQRLRQDEEQAGRDPLDTSDPTAMMTRFREKAAEVVHILRAARVPGVKLPKTKGKEPVRERERERNARLLEFVAERVVPFGRLLDGNLKPGRPGREGVPWQGLLDEWHVTNPGPGDWKPSTDALKMAYYAAARTRYFAHRFLSQVRAEVNDEWTMQSEALWGLMKAFAELPEGVRTQLPIDPEGSPQHQKGQQRFAAALRKQREAVEKRAAQLALLSPAQRRVLAESERATEAAERREFRAGLTRRDLLAERVSRLVWRMRGDLASEKAAEEALRAPLRDWFLVEARGGQGSHRNRSPFGPS